MKVTLFTGLFAILYKTALCGQCPDMWMKFGSNCYFFATDFPGGNFWETAAFCKMFGPNAHLAEINSMAEYYFLRDTVKSLGKWPLGPWLGMIRPHSTKTTYMNPSTGKEADDPEFNEMVHNLESRVQINENCMGFDANGNGFGFWNCTHSGSPLCEIDAGVSIQGTATLILCSLAITLFSCFVNA
ncbi:C-type lectin mannose-binding isoform-like [Paramacrobiotus metropolitanus]|uniref:C-type lectin mannose-binding isoform-like n=1 Tax=Paramacrobiotus metropolitanus TaxID=2943436 RepID=UPI002445B58D|nr:C-type lectin mannose-binding isoform-like [Paramacrobiotus metropolitanus]